MDLDFEEHEDDWEELVEYMQEWDQWRRKENHLDTPAWTDENVYILPLTISLLRSERRLEKLTRVLLYLTAVMAILTAVNITVLLI